MSELALTPEGRGHAFQALFKNNHPHDAVRDPCRCHKITLKHPDTTIVYRALAAYEICVDIASTRPLPTQTYIRIWVPAISYWLLRLKQSHRDQPSTLKDYFRSTLKVDYLGPASMLIIRNPTLADTAIRNAMTTVLKLNLRRLPDVEAPALGTGKKLREMFYLSRRPIVCDGDPDEFTDGEKTRINSTRRMPDAALFYVYRGGSARFPAIVLEVGSGKKAEELEELVKWYFEVGKGQTRIVITVTVEYSMTITIHRLVGGDVRTGAVEKRPSMCGPGGGVMFKTWEMLPAQVIHDAMKGRCEDWIAMEWRFEFDEIAEVLKG